MGNAVAVCCIFKYVCTVYVTCLCDAYVADCLVAIHQIHIPDKPFLSVCE